MIPQERRPFVRHSVTRWLSAIFVSAWSFAGVPCDAASGNLAGYVVDEAHEFGSESIAEANIRLSRLYSATHRVFVIHTVDDIRKSLLEDSRRDYASLPSGSIEMYVVQSAGTEQVLSDPDFKSQASAIQHVFDADMVHLQADRALLDSTATALAVIGAKEHVEIPVARDPSLSGPLPSSADDASSSFPFIAVAGILIVCFLVGFLVFLWWRRRLARVRSGVPVQYNVNSDDAVRSPLLFSDSATGVSTPSWPSVVPTVVPSPDDVSDVDLDVLDVPLTGISVTHPVQPEAPVQRSGFWRSLEERQSRRPGSLPTPPPTAPVLVDVPKALVDQDSSSDVEVEETVEDFSSDITAPSSDSYHDESLSHIPSYHDEDVSFEPEEDISAESTEDLISSSPTPVSNTSEEIIPTVDSLTSSSADLSVLQSPLLVDEGVPSSDPLIHVDRQFDDVDGHTAATSTKSTDLVSTRTVQSDQSDHSDHHDLLDLSSVSWSVPGPQHDDNLSPSGTESGYFSSVEQPLVDSIPTAVDPLDFGSSAVLPDDEVTTHSVTGDVVHAEASDVLSWPVSAEQIKTGVPILEVDTLHQTLISDDPFDSVPSEEGEDPQPNVTDGVSQIDLQDRSYETLSEKQESIVLPADKDISLSRTAESSDSSEFAQFAEPDFEESFDDGRSEMVSSSRPTHSEDEDVLMGVDLGSLRRDEDVEAKEAQHREYLRIEAETMAATFDPIDFDDESTQQHR